MLQRRFWYGRRGRKPSQISPFPFSLSFRHENGNPGQRQARTLERPKETEVRARWTISRMPLALKAALFLCSVLAVYASSSQRKYDGSTLSYDPQV